MRAVIVCVAALMVACAEPPEDATTGASTAYLVLHVTGDYAGRDLEITLDGNSVLNGPQPPSSGSGPEIYHEFIKDQALLTVLLDGREVMRKRIKAWQGSRARLRVDADSVALRQSSY